MPQFISTLNNWLLGKLRKGFCGITKYITEWMTDEKTFFLNLFLLVVLVTSAFLSPLTSHVIVGILVTRKTPDWSTSCSEDLIFQVMHRFFLVFFFYYKIQEYLHLLLYQLFTSGKEALANVEGLRYPLGLNIVIKLMSNFPLRQGQSFATV